VGVGEPVAWLAARRPARSSLLRVFCFLVGVSGATRGQTDMRGLVTAGRAVRRERAAGLESERGHDQHGVDRGCS
jgi:hypothetical protein